MIVHAADSDNEDSVTITDLPVAQKPLRKGFNFFKSGHVSDVKFNKLEDYTHVSGMVLSSYKSKTFQTDLVLKNSTDEVMKGKCKCAAGLGGKCNHIAIVLFGLLDFQESLNDAPESCTSKEQKWHQPSRKAKKLTKPIKTGVCVVQKHVFGRSVRRKRPLENYDGYSVRMKKAILDTSALKEDLKQLPHETGLLMILNSSTDTASEGEEERINTHQLPEEIVCQKLKVTEARQKEIEKQTRGQANNPLWFRHKKGRITASMAKKFVRKGDIGTLVKDIIQIRKPKLTSIPAVKYGIDNEVVVLKYKQQKAAQGVNITVCGCGLFVDLEFGQLAASPDGLITDPSEKDPHGLVEIKCIYSCRDISPKEAIERKRSSSQFSLKAVGETIIMKESHSHYYQIQMQMGVTKRRWGDFVLFTKEDEEVLILHVNFDPSFWEKVKEKLLDFHTMNIVPALVAQGFYKKKDKNRS